MSSDSQQPLKRLKLENQSGNSLNGIDGLEKTLENLIDIILKYNSIKYQSDEESIKNKINYIKYFNRYHQSKFPHYFNFNSYINFILDVFFDTTSIKIFNQLKYINGNYSMCYLLNCIINDTRFKEWFKGHYENDYELLKYKFKLVDRQRNTHYLDLDQLYIELFSNSGDCNSNISFNSINSSNSNSSDNIIVLDNQYKYNTIYKKHSNTFTSHHDNNSNNNSSRNNNNSTYSINSKPIPNYIIETILSLAIESTFKEKYQSPCYLKYLVEFNQLRMVLFSISKFSNYAMVSKQFLKVFSKIFNHQLLKENYFYRWKSVKRVSMIESGFGSSSNNSTLVNESDKQYSCGSPFSFIDQQYPITFHYDTIKSISYNISKENLQLYFSKIQIFYLLSDEYDSSVDQDEETIRDLLYSDNVSKCEKYKSSILKENYLVIPPPMPSLKSVIVEGYYGHTSNYSNLLISIFNSNCPNKSNRSQNLVVNGYSSSTISIQTNEVGNCNCNTCTGNGGIEYFSIEVNHDSAFKPDYNDISFFKALLLYHSKSLKRIDLKLNINNQDVLDEFFKVFDEMVGFKSNRVQFGLTYSRYRYENFYP